ncbi:MAG: hypothetical protein JO171_18655 [Paludibacterium sp.]|uniref:hypothetical protein n=1 Tax=Paludibacterium sp. TaxID=1917523 RepID=UPI0025F91B3E|nr:hypothetical protein [Paludibacterium sp.]MBV8049176.1 hypothetical protein [Paludibacterium sp.]MBV8646203.1 hypothetical protein [Paludibacterium sp.]
MKALTILLLTSLMLTGCGSFKQWPSPIFSGHGSAARPAAAQPSHVSLIFREANRLAGEVEAGRLSRTEAADQLNVYRVRVAGSNRVDDSTFATYRYLAISRDRNEMTAEESHARMEMKLRDWQRKWPALSNRPADPAFTNFLMQLFDLPPLQNPSP